MKLVMERPIVARQRQRCGDQPDPTAHSGRAGHCLKEFFLSERLCRYFALEALKDKPPLGPAHLLAHASFLGELEAPVIGGLLGAHARQVRNTYFVRCLVLCLCGNIAKNGIITPAKIVIVMTRSI
jgi:hypothetical protein